MSSLLFLASFAAGMLNAFAGGGSFLTIPALVALGIPPIAASATSTVIMLPGSMSAVFAYRKQLRNLTTRQPLTQIALTCLIAGLMGTVLLLVTSNQYLIVLMPWLILSVTCLFALGPRLADYLQKRQIYNPKAHLLILAFAALLGGYFSGGLGILLLCAFSLSGSVDFHEMNVLKTLIICLMNIVSFVVFGLSGIVYWPEAITMTLGICAGGYLGTRLILHLPQALLRRLVVVIGSLMTIFWFIKAHVHSDFF